MACPPPNAPTKPSVSARRRAVLRRRFDGKGAALKADPPPPYGRFAQLTRNEAFTGRLSRSLENQGYF